LAKGRPIHRCLIAVAPLGKPKRMRADRQAPQHVVGCAGWVRIMNREQQNLSERQRFEHFTRSESRKSPSRSTLTNETPTDGLSYFRASGRVESVGRFSSA